MAVKQSIAVEPLIKEVTLNASSSDVWKAITDKDEMKQWYFDLEEFKPEVGFEFKFFGETEKKQYLHLCKITEVIPEKKLSHSWRYDGYPGESFVTFELYPEGEKTRLRLKHEGLESFPADNTDFAKENFIEGWNQIIGTSIKEYLEKSAKQKFIAKAEININAPAAKVWEALTTPELIKQYLFDTNVTTDWKVGSPITYKGEWDGKTYEDKGKILQVEPEKLLVSTYWSSFSGWPDIPENYKTVTYKLSAEGNRTKLTIIQNNNNTQEVADHSEKNWNMVLSSLKELLESK